MASDATQILHAISAGDRSDAEKLMHLVYDDLRGLARAYLGGDTPNQTLDPFFISTRPITWASGATQ